MSKFCTQCGAVATDDAKWCNQCGNALRTPPIAEDFSLKTEAPQKATEQTKANQDTELQEELLKASTPESKVAAEADAEPMPEEEAAPEATPTPPQSSSMPEEKSELPNKAPRNAPPQQKRSSAPKKAKGKKPEKAKKDGKKKSLKGLLIVAIILLVISALVGIFFFCFGDYLSLKSHSAEVVESLNSGNRDFSSFQPDLYAELPLYAVKMMGESKDQTEAGPFVVAMAPYVSFEIVEQKAFMGSGEVKYRVTSRDLCEFVISIDPETVKTTDELRQKIIEYIPSAPVKEYYVTVQYTKSGSSWRGNYETPEFADAITGGLNTAYNQLYEKMLKEMEEIFK